MAEVAVATLIATIAMVSGIAFFVKAFSANYRVSDFVLAQDKSSSMAEEMQIFVMSSAVGTALPQSFPGNIIDWRIERVENGWIVHISAIADRTESLPQSTSSTNPGVGFTKRTPGLVQIFCFSMWPVSEATAFGIYNGGYQSMWNLDQGGTGTGSSCMNIFRGLNSRNNMTAIRLKTAYARFAYETR